MVTTALILGAGAPRGLGSAIARRFAKQGFRTLFSGRNQEKLAQAEAEMKEESLNAQAVAGDVRDEDFIRSLVKKADDPEAPLEAAIFNAGGNWPKPFLEMDAAFLEEMWQVNARAGFIFAHAALQAMLPRKRGSLFFTGASASMRGRASFAAFASAKAALRALAQSAAREFSPQNIHVAHIVIDGAIDGERINRLLPNLKAHLGEDGLLNPDHIAENYWRLHQQQRTAWTHELDLRPWKEKW